MKCLGSKSLRRIGAALPTEHHKANGVGHVSRWHYGLDHSVARLYEATYAEPDEDFEAVNVSRCR
jgi:hypothetical protein